MTSYDRRRLAAVTAPQSLLPEIHRRAAAAVVHHDDRIQLGTTPGGRLVARVVPGTEIDLRQLATIAV